MTEPTSLGASMDHYFAVLNDEKILPLERRRNLEFYLERYLFHDVDFASKSVLEIGAGEGLYSFYAASKGAKEVVCLEPEAEGSTSGVLRTFDKIRSKLAVGNSVSLKAISFQEYKEEERKFDIVLLYDTINHLDEAACMDLQNQQSAVETYRGIFDALKRLCNPSAKLIIADCSRYNFWHRIGLTNPFAPTVEWDKHQSPKLWSKLLSESGFHTPTVRWRGWRTHGLREPGLFLLGNQIATYFLDSHFCLTMQRR